MRLQLNFLFQGIILFDFLWSLNVGQTNDSSHIFKTFGSDGTLVDQCFIGKFFLLDRRDFDFDRTTHRETQQSS